MKNNIMNIFQFSPERFKNPFVITGLIIAIIGMFLLFLLEKLIFKMFEKTHIKKYLDKDTQTQMDIRVDNVRYKSKIIGKVVSLVIVFVGVILCLQGV